MSISFAGPFTNHQTRNEVTICISLTALAQFAGRSHQGKEGKSQRRFFVRQSDGSFVVAHSVALSSSLPSRAAAPTAAAAAVVVALPPSLPSCRVFPGNAPYFPPFDIFGESEILARVTKRFDADVTVRTACVLNSDTGQPHLRH